MRQIYEDERLIAYYKEKGEHTLPSSDYTKDDSLFLYRLDKVTSGVLIKAKSEDMYNELKQLQKEGRIIKTYVAVSRKASSTHNMQFDNEVKENLTFSISTYFRPYGEGRKSVKAVKSDEVKKYKNKDVTKHIYTTSIVDSRCEKDKVIFTVEIDNGFRHQIRSHLAFIGYPIIGDTLYGGTTLAEEEGLYKNGIALECTRVKIGNVIVHLSDCR